MNAASAVAARDPDRSVFINCPFDEEYQRLFDAIVFGITAYGFIPRSAMEGDDSEDRMERIFTALDTSRYSIHDLSRCRGEADENLARFNMPLEFGMAFGKGYPRYDGQRRHNWMVLVPEGNLYKKYVSDLSGYDLRAHDGTPEDILRHVRRWLSPKVAATTGVEATDRTPRITLPRPAQLIEEFATFSRELNALRAEERGDPPWHEILGLAREVAATAGFPLA
jgi:hypothetical protein